MGDLDRDGLEAAVEEVREFSRMYTRVVGRLDWPESHREQYSLAELRVVHELTRRERTHVHSLREELGITAAHLSRLLGGFEKRGLVTRERNMCDARHQQVSLTDAGRALAAAVADEYAASVARLLRGCNGARLRELVDALRTARATLAGPPARADIRLREPAAGDLGWVVRKHGEVYDAEFGWGEGFEALVAKAVAGYAVDRDPLREQMWIAALDGRPVGCVMCVRGDEPGIGRLRLLLVDPAVRGYGLGSQLVRRCVKFAQEAGYSELTVRTDSVLAAARALCTRIGFTVVGEMPYRRYGTESTGQEWRLRLPPG